jgi:hypothetical protein
MTVTIDSLLDIATAAEQAGDRRAEEQALAGARWLEEQGLDEAKQVGNFGGKTLSRGQKVRIKKGTVILSMHPRYTRDNPKIAARAYPITIHRVDEGYIQSNWHPHRRDQAVRNQQVVWPGEGGYWCYADTADVEVV